MARRYNPVRPGRDRSIRGATANSDVTMTAEPGQITALIGPHGPGQTTLITAVTGFVCASSTAHIGDQSLTGLPRHSRRRLGLARTWPAGRRTLRRPQHPRQHS
jgi:branched-chain amino acid transport system ATP-binding protein